MTGGYDAQVACPKGRLHLMRLLKKVSGTNLQRVHGQQIRNRQHTVLADRVGVVGRVPQAHGARLLRACDIYVSPHNTHMVDSRFFGSPTKFFEYMAMARAVVGGLMTWLAAGRTSVPAKGDYPTGLRVDVVVMPTAMTRAPSAAA